MRSHNNSERHTGASFAPARAHADRLLTIATLAAMLAVLLIVATQKPVLSQGVALVRVDVAMVGKAHRASKLTGQNVVNEKNEKIGTLDDILITSDRKLFAIVQVGGVLGIGSHFVALPYESLVIDATGRRIELPGASKDELKKLAEFKYLT